MFTDVRFMSADEKSKLLKAWVTFVRYGFQRQHFSKRIYDHLHLHCGHIAHFDIDGFYATWFNHGTDRVEFMRYFFEYRVMEDYLDITEAMREVLQPQVEILREAARVEEIARLTAERESIEARLEILCNSERSAAA